MSEPVETAAPPCPSAPQDLAIVLGGGGARAAYQIGLLRCLARLMPELRFPIITGVSAGAINAAYLAAYEGRLEEAADNLSHLWSNLTVEEVFCADTPYLLKNVARWGIRLFSGGWTGAPEVRSFVDTTPLAKLLRRALATVDDEIPGIVRNIEQGRLKAIALTTLNYNTGQTVTWVQGCEIDTWERPHRRSRKARLTVDHVMASAALPLFFPAVRLGDSWYGDGGIRLVAPLSPALHLGARRVLAISTRYPRSFEEADRPVVQGYPPPAQILGQLINAIFLDLLDQDHLRLERLNQLLRKLPSEDQPDLKPVDVVILRPSQDLGQLAGDYEVNLPGALRFMTRGLGSRETRSADLLSLIMFQPDYLRRLIEIGEADAEAHREEIRALVMGKKEEAVTTR